MKGGNSFDTLARELRIRNYSPRTVDSYIFYNREFLRFCQKSSRAATVNDIRDYLDFLARERSASTISVAYNALLFYYKTVCGRQFFINLPHPRKEKHVPVVLSKEEVERMLTLTVNRKHHCILSLLYGTGVRVSELTHIRMYDIDLDRMVLRVYQGKGKKDRFTILPVTLRGILSNQTRLKNPSDWLFTNGRHAVADKHANNRLTEATIQKIVAEAARRAAIAKKVSPHTLRHTFATHLLENGTDIRYIQELLGHAKLQTTQIYTHVARNSIAEITSPLDL